MAEPKGVGEKGKRKLVVAIGKAQLAAATYKNLQNKDRKMGEQNPRISEKQTRKKEDFTMVSFVTILQNGESGIGQSEAWERNTVTFFFCLRPFYILGATCTVVLLLARPY